MSMMMPPQQGGFDPAAAIQTLLGGAGAGDAQSTDQQDPPNSGADILRQILQLAGAYRAQEQDEQNKLDMEQASTLIQRILANEQKEADGMLSGKATPRAMRRAAGSVGGGY